MNQRATFLALLFLAQFTFTQVVGQFEINYFTDTAPTSGTNIHVSLEELETRYPRINEEVAIKLEIPGVTEILNGVLNTLRLAIVKAIEVIYPIAPRTADQLYNILNEIVEAINGLATPSGISELIQHLIRIVQDAIVGVGGLIQDKLTFESKLVGPALNGVLTGLKGLLSGLKTVQPAAQLVSGPGGLLFG